MILDGDQILDGHRHTKQGALRVGLSRREGLVGPVRLWQRIRGIVAEERADMTIDALNLFEAGLHGRARRDLASGELPGQFGNRQLINHAVHRLPAPAYYKNSLSFWRRGSERGIHPLTAHIGQRDSMLAQTKPA